MNFELFKNFCRQMSVQDELLCNVIWDLETGDKLVDFHNYIDTYYPYLSQYIVIKDDSECEQNEDVIYYMENLADRANKMYLDAYLVANYLVDKRPELVDKHFDEWKYSLDMVLTDGGEEEKELRAEYDKTDEELQELYNDLETFAKQNTKSQINNVKVSNNIASLFDEVKQNMGKSTIVTSFNLKEIRQRRELDSEPIKRINTEQYAKLFIEYIKALLKRASEMNKTDGYLVARDFEDYGIGRLKFGDRNHYWKEYSENREDYLVSSKELNIKDMLGKPGFNTLDCFSIDGDILTLRLNFSSETSSNDRGDSFVDGGIPKYDKLDFEYLKELLWNEGIVIERESKSVSKDGGWTHKNIDVLTIKYYRNEKDKESCL